MRFAFLSWLFVLVCAAFGITFGYSHFRYRAYAESRAQEIMSANLSDLMEQLQNAELYISTIESITNISAIERTRAVADITRLDPSLIQNKQKLQELCNDLSIREIYFTDNHGNIVAGLPKAEGNISQFEQDESFAECLEKPGTEICTRTYGTGAGRSMQYVCVHRRDTPGAILTVFSGPREQSARRDLTYNNIARSYKVGENGRIIAFRDGAMLGEDLPPFPTVDLLSMPVNRTQLQTLGDTDYYTYAMRRKDFFLVALLPVSELQEASSRALYPVFVIYVLLFAAIFLLIFFLLQRLVIRNIQRINTSLRKITGGNLNERINAQNAPSEFRKLASSINAMVEALQTYGKRNEESTQRELSLARTIQNTIIPNTFPAFPLHTEFDIFATCRQAKIVGGGFYDFFMQGDEYLCFMVADVSGNGVPAALYVLHSMSIIRELAHSGATPIDLVTKTNRALCNRRFVNMYMSLFYGVLEVNTGKLVFVNAGPPQALLKHKGQRFERLEMCSGTELGRSPNAVYTTCTEQLSSGDRLFLYTEGAVDATNPEMDIFGEQRLHDAINSVTTRSIADVPRRVSAAHRKFTQGSEQTRDITMLALEYIGKKREQVSCCISSDAPDKTDAFLSEHLEEVFASPIAISELQQAVRRIAAKLPRNVEILLHMDYDEEVAEVTLTYPPPAFNPLLHLSELLVDRMEYLSSDEGHNNICLWKKIS